jgi:hypothetical protein
MIDQAQHTTHSSQRLLAVARVFVLLWILFTLLSLTISIPSRFQNLNTLILSDVPGSPFYGWSVPQIQATLVELGLPIEIVTGTMLAASLVCLTCFLLVGCLLFWRRSDTWVGLSAAFILIGTSLGFSNLHFSQGELPLWVNPFFLLQAIFLWPTAFVMLYLFPNGKFIPRFTRHWVVVPYLLFPLDEFFPNSNLSGFLAVVYIVGGVISQIYRYRQVSTHEERQQTKWVVFALGLIIGLALATETAPSFFPTLAVNTTPSFLYDWVTTAILNILEPALLPLALGISILRYRLFEIDLIIRRTLQYSFLTGLLGLIYFGSVLLLQGIMGQTTGERSPLVLVLSTLLIAALFTPLRRRIQNLIDRRFFRQKYDAAQVLADFARTARDETDINQLTARLVQVVQESLQPEQVSLWLKPTEKPKRGNYGG